MSEYLICGLPGCGKYAARICLSLQKEGKPHDIFFCSHTHLNEFRALENYSEAVHKAWKLQYGHLRKGVK